MKLAKYSAAAVCLFAFGTFTRAADPIDLDWNDSARNRAVPVRIYLPSDDKPQPVVIFSHGLGGSRKGYAYLGQCWSEHGFVAVHVQHVGSDDSVWKGAGLNARANLTAAANGKELAARAADVKFTIDQLTALNADPKSPLHDRLDLSKIAIAGHSFGGHTAQAIAGQHFPAGYSMADPRVSCAIVMSPSPPKNRNATAAAFGDLALPILFMTGTLDDSPIDDLKAPDRRLPFDAAKPGDKYLVTFDKAAHGVFASGQRPGRKQSDVDAKDQPLILKSTTAFLNAYLKGDASAKTYLQKQFAIDAGDAAKVEQK